MKQLSIHVTVLSRGKLVAIGTITFSLLCFAWS